MNRKKENRFVHILGVVLRYVVATVSISIVFYILFALLFSTEEEKRLERENAMYAKLYPVLKEKERLVGDVIEGLYQKDDTLYRRPSWQLLPGSLFASNLLQGHRQVNFQVFCSF